MQAAYRLPWQEGVARLKKQAQWLDALHPDAAASLREGLEETFTINRLELSASLRLCLATTNVIESPHSGVRMRTRRVSRWKDGQMVQIAPPAVMAGQHGTDDPALAAGHEACAGVPGEESFHVLRSIRIVEPDLRVAVGRDVEHIGLDPRVYKEQIVPAESFGFVDGPVRPLPPNLRHVRRHEMRRLPYPGPVYELLPKAVHAAPQLPDWSTQDEGMET